MATTTKTKTTKRTAPDDVPVWSAFCESLGTRCTYVHKGVRCDNGVTTGTRCASHQEAK